MGLIGPDHTKIKLTLQYQQWFSLSSSYIVSSCQFCTDQYNDVSAICTTQCFHMRSSHEPTQNSYAKTASGPGSEASTQTCLYVFSMQNEVPIVSELPRFAWEGETPSSHTYLPRLLGPTQGRRRHFKSGQATAHKR